MNLAGRNLANVFGEDEILALIARQRAPNFPAGEPFLDTSDSSQHAANRSCRMPREQVRPRVNVAECTQLVLAWRERWHVPSS
jgi:hypothetical protein